MNQINKVEQDKEEAVAEKTSVSVEEQSVALATNYNLEDEDLNSSTISYNTSWVLK